MISHFRLARANAQVAETQHPINGPARTLYTIGHSNRSLDDFIDLLQGAAVGQLIDVRGHPGSRRFPLFNRNSLKLTLADEGIAYAWFGRELGGLRREKTDSPHTALASNGFRGYADHMASNLFQAGMEQLTTLARYQPVAIMCAEREPCQCHRSMIADYLLLRGWRVIHLIDIHLRREHSFSPLARSQDRLPVYDRLDQEQLNLSF